MLVMFMIDDIEKHVIIDFEVVLIYWLLLVSEIDKRVNCNVVGLQSWSLFM